MDKKEQTRLRVERYRNKKKSVTSGSVTTPSVTLKSITGEALHPIMEALIDPVKRKKLEAITQSLKAHHVSELVSYGCRNPIPFDVVGELLEATG